jgi:molybdopterin/thiamine biosynthesis adenylyltransferase
MDFLKVYKPTILNASENEIEGQLHYLMQQPCTLVSDTLTHQLAEYIKCTNPGEKYSKEQLLQMANDLIAENPVKYNNWVFYPWSNRLIRLLPKEEFIALRTNRNCYKITPAERDLLATKKIGVVGLSVGQSIALTLAMERSFGELRLADFDTLDLSNLNRIRSGVHNLGLNKAIITAREIYEIDPYLNVICFTDGLTEDNIENYFTANGNLDILIDECDGLDIKILARYKAKSMKIPVFMDTSDRGMVDIERFDLEPERPILHGLVGELNPDEIKGLTNEQKIPYILPMIGYESISTRLKASMMEIDETITTWPQLASSVVMGGGVGADITRKILLGQSTVSGRFYVDLDDILPEPANTTKQDFPNPYEPLNPEICKQIISNHSAVKNITAKYIPNQETITHLVNLACTAPSGGNCQPWFWYFEKGILFVFHDKYQSYSMLDYNHNGSMIAIGAAIENMSIAAAKYNLNAIFTSVLKSNNDILVGYVLFEPTHETNPLKAGLYDAITLRESNRLLVDSETIITKDLTCIESVVNNLDFGIKWISQKSEIEKFAAIAAAVERIRLLHPQGHQDFINEIRWDRVENETSMNGIDLDTVDLTLSEKAALRLAKDGKAIDFLNKLQLGKSFEKLMKKTLSKAPVVGLLYAKNCSNFLTAGFELERVWLMANKMGLAFHPVSPCTFVFKRIQSNAFENFEPYMIEELKQNYADFKNLFALNPKEEGIFAFKLFKTPLKPKRSLRKPLNNVFYINQ